MRLLMKISLEEAKNYLRVEHSEDDHLIQVMISASEELCSSILRKNLEEVTEEKEVDFLQTIVLFGTAYLYEHREERGQESLVELLKALLSAHRRDVF
nr:MAG TPA: head tail connector [Caudoviricetes sp.]